ncbi:hypothetical protein CsatA_013241 [Cannabis sativa]
MENVTIMKTAGIVKIAGLVACVGGVMTLTLYKGPHLNPLLHHHPIEYHHPQHEHKPHSSSNKRWLIGCSLFLLGTFAWSFFLVLQAQILKSYPDGLRLTSLLCLLSTGQCFVFAIALERNPSEWKLGWNIELLTIIYSIKGPVFIAISQPFTLIITMIGSVLLLGEAMNLGSVLGGILLVVSLYAVLWGKSKDQTLQNQSNSDNKAEAHIPALEEAEVKKNHYEDDIPV